MEVAIRQVQDSAELDACYLLRMAVFVDEQKVPPWEEMDSYDEGAQHFALFCDGAIVGTARVVDLGEGTGKVGRVAIRKELRGTGLGRRLMNEVVAYGFTRYDRLILDAQISVQDFYTKLGFAAEGDNFLDCGIEHIRMTAARST